jgi:hypothetical protein
MEVTHANVFALRGYESIFYFHEPLFFGQMMPNLLMVLQNYIDFRNNSPDIAFDGASIFKDAELGFMASKSSEYTPS